MHEYGVVYLNRGNDLYAVKDIPECYQFYRPQAVKSCMLKSRTILFLKILEKLERGDFASYFGRPIPINY